MSDKNIEINASIQELPVTGGPYMPNPDGRGGWIPVPIDCSKVKDSLPSQPGLIADVSANDIIIAGIDVDGNCRYEIDNKQKVQELWTGFVADAVAQLPPFQDVIVDKALGAKFSVAVGTCSLVKCVKGSLPKGGRQACNPNLGEHSADIGVTNPNKIANALCTLYKNAIFDKVCSSTIRAVDGTNPDNFVGGDITGRLKEQCTCIDWYGKPQKRDCNKCNPQRDPPCPRPNKKTLEEIAPAIFRGASNNDLIMQNMNRYADKQKDKFCPKQKDGNNLQCRVQITAKQLLMDLGAVASVIYIEKGTGAKKIIPLEIPKARQSFKVDDLMQTFECVMNITGYNLNKNINFINSNSTKRGKCIVPGSGGGCLAMDLSSDRVPADLRGLDFCCPTVNYEVCWGVDNYLPRTKDLPPNGEWVRWMDRYPIMMKDVFVPRSVVTVKDILCIAEQYVACGARDETGIKNPNGPITAEQIVKYRADKCTKPFEELKNAYVSVLNKTKAAAVALQQEVKDSIDKEAAKVLRDKADCLSTIQFTYTPFEFGGGF